MSTQDIIECWDNGIEPYISAKQRFNASVTHEIRRYLAIGLERDDDETQDDPADAGQETPTLDDGRSGGYGESYAERNT